MLRKRRSAGACTDQSSFDQTCPAAGISTDLCLKFEVCLVLVCVGLVGRDGQSK